MLKVVGLIATTVLQVSVKRMSHNENLGLKESTRSTRVLSGLLPGMFSVRVNRPTRCLYPGPLRGGLLNTSGLV